MLSGVSEFPSEERRMSLRSALENFTSPDAINRQRCALHMWHSLCECILELRTPTLQLTLLYGFRGSPVGRSVLTFTSTVCLDTELGLALGVSLSVLTLLREAAYPHTATLGLVESEDTGEQHWRNLSRFGVAKQP